MNAIMKQGRHNECHMSPEVRMLIRTFIYRDHVFSAQNVGVFLA